jgi:hypothetical protein
MQTGGAVRTIAEEYDRVYKGCQRPCPQGLWYWKGFVCYEYRWMGKTLSLDPWQRRHGFTTTLSALRSVRFDPSLWTVENRGKSHGAQAEGAL